MTVAERDAPSLRPPTDFSVASLGALSHALLLAEKYGAELDLLHAQVLHEEDDGAEGFPQSAVILERLYEIAGSELHERLGLDPIHFSRISDTEFVFQDGII